MDFLRKLAPRLREPSTYAGLMGIFTVLHLTVPGYVPGVIEATGMFAGALLAIFLPETPKE